MGNQCSFQNLRARLFRGTEEVQALQRSLENLHARLQTKTEEVQALQQSLETYQRNIQVERNMSAALRSEVQTTRTLQESLQTCQIELQDERNMSAALRSEIETTRCSLDTLRQEHFCKIPRSEISFYDGGNIGHGAFGNVTERTFRGVRVAVKGMHAAIQSRQNQDLFAKEIKIAALIRHPCIVQFLAVADYSTNNPLLVTELMNISLPDAMAGDESLCEQRKMLIVGLDIACALNYLHQFQPIPIVHRDVSSHNVLMWKQDKEWRGKLTDFGAADFVSSAMTTFPGNPIYSAPESSTPQQSPKMDVYNFGVLCCEIATRETPNQEYRQHQIDRIGSDLVRTLVVRCTQMNPWDRPTMDDVIHSLERII